MQRIKDKLTLFNSTMGLLEYIGLDKQKIEHKIVKFFLPINFNICFGCSKEPSH